MDTLKRRRVNIAWQKPREITRVINYDIAPIDKNMNGLEITVEPGLKNKVIEIKRAGDRIVALRLV